MGNVARLAVRMMIFVVDNEALAANKNGDCRKAIGIHMAKISVKPPAPVKCGNIGHGEHGNREMFR